MGVWFAKPIPGGTLATVPFSNSPLMAFIETWILELSNKFNWVIFGIIFDRPIQFEFPLAKA